LLSANVIELPVANTAGTVNAIAVGLDGDIWYSESLLSGGNVLGRINPSTGAVIGQYPVASSSLTVPSLVAGPDNKIWFTESSGNIGRLDPLTGNVSEFAANSPDDITVGPDDNLWFTNHATGQIGRITTSGVITEFPLASNQNAPAEIIPGAVSNLWFSESLNGQVGRIGVITTTGQVTEFPTQVGQTGSAGIAGGPDGNLWVTDAYGNQIDRINPNTGTVTGQFTPPTANSFPFGMTLGPDKNLYFTEQYGDKIGEFNPFNPTVMTEIPVPTSAARPDQIVTGHDGNLWFSEQANPAIGVVEISGHGPSPGASGPVGGIGGGSATPPKILVAGPLFQTVDIGKPHKGHVKTRNPLVGFELTFNEAIDASRAANTRNYSVLVNSRHGRRTTTKPAGFSVSYNPNTFTVSLLLSGKQKFPKGGQLTVNSASPSGIADPSGDVLVGNTVFTIGPGARAVKP
jgi:virginiamycin B lyase